MINRLSQILERVYSNNFHLVRGILILCIEKWIDSAVFLYDNYTLYICIFSRCYLSIAANAIRRILNTTQSIQYHFYAEQFTYIKVICSCVKMFLPLHGWRSSLPTRLSTPFPYSIVRESSRAFWFRICLIFCNLWKIRQPMRCHRVMYLCVRCSPAMLNMVIWRKTATPAVTPAAANRHVMRNRSK